MRRVRRWGLDSRLRTRYVHYSPGPTDHCSFPARRPTSSLLAARHHAVTTASTGPRMCGVPLTRILHGSEPAPVSRTPVSEVMIARGGVLNARSHAAGVPPQDGGTGASAGEAHPRHRPRPG